MNILVQDLKCAWHTNELRTLLVPQGVFNLTPKDHSRTAKVAAMPEIRPSEKRKLYDTALYRYRHLISILLFAEIPGTVGS